jgi:DNA-binding winged helix-turn-helix (wHTH) protein
MSQEPKANWLFGPFCLDSQQRVLLRDGKPIALTSKAFEILNLLVENHGRALSKEEMMRQVWPASFVDESNLAQHIFHLRKVLGDTHEGQAYIETLPRHGYRFVAAVEQAPAKRAENAVANADGSQAAVAAGETRSSTKLRWVIGAAAGLVLAVFTLVYVGRTRIWAPSAASGGKVMLAVLAFENLSGDPQQEYLSSGLTEELITQLGSLEPKRLGVIARTSAMQYKDSHKDVRQISRELGVD